jgi:hypothetical protein
MNVANGAIRQVLAQANANANANHLPTRKEICVFYFGETPVNAETNQWKCSCGVRRKCNVAKRGHGNLFSHIREKHENHVEAMRLFSEAQAEGREIAVNPSAQRAAAPANVQRTLDYLLDGRSQNMYKWIEWVVKSELELSFVDDSLNRSNIALSDTDSRTLKKYMFRLMKAVEEKISRLAAGSKYALVFDGWSENGRHFIGTCGMIRE